MNNLILTQIETKIQTIQELKHKRQIWNFKNQQVVFTNGCFDILHDGHIHTLANAAQQGPILIVGLNSDDSIKRLKGNSRPIQNQQTRALLLASLFFIDYVVIFDEDTPYNLINELQPNILVKGGDYNPTTIIGADIVKQNGGKVVTVPFLHGYSSSLIINKINKQN